MFITKKQLENRIHEAVMREREKLEEREWINRRLRDVDAVFQGYNNRICELQDQVRKLEVRAHDH